MKATLSILTIAALAAVVPGHASTISASFTGTVSQTTGATGRAVGNTISGHFDVDSVTGSFLDFMIDGKSPLAGYLSTEAFTAGNFDAIYTAQVSPVALGTPSNSSFTLDLSSLSNWPFTDTPLTLLLDNGQLATNLDTIGNPMSSNPSFFSYYTAQSNGSNVVALRANLTSISAVPEPANVSLVMCSLLGVGVFLRRRRV